MYSNRRQRYLRLLSGIINLYRDYAMKKTLIALAVAASAVVSGSVSATGWTQNGNGFPFEISGTLTVVEKVTPWEVKIGDAMNNMDVPVERGSSLIYIPVGKDSLILAIRPKEKVAFSGETPNITPQIEFGGAVDMTSFKDGRSTFSVDVTDPRGQRIGKMVAIFESAAEASRYKTNDSSSGKFNMYASEAGQFFYGGLGQSAESIATNCYDVAMRYQSNVIFYYDDQGLYGAVTKNSFAPENGKTYSGYYTAGIPAGDSILINLDKPVAGDEAITWKASLPVTVTYM